MYYELALISVLIAAGYWGFYFVRYHARVRTYGLMQLGAAIGAGLGLYHRRAGGPAWFGIAGAVGTGAGACLLLVGPLVRGAARRFAGIERFGLAEKLLAIADLLAPGSGVAEERQLLVAMREIRDGKIDQTLGALAAARAQASPDKRLAIDERTAMLYLTAYRWDEAIAYAEEHLFTIEAPREGQPTALRRALGIAPPVWVELLGAYGYKGNLEQAARMLARLEDVCAGRDDAAIWVHRGRMVFLALAGRVAAVVQLTDKHTSRHMSRGARAYWLAVAHERNGDARAARIAYAKARSKSRGRPRTLIDQALEHLDEIKPIELTPRTQELVTRVEAAPAPIIALRERPRGPWVTRGLTASMFVVAGVMLFAVGDSTDLGVLVRSGAMVRGLIHTNGEWWRLVSCNFVHVGGLHLLINALGLWVLGKLCEEMFGRCIGRDLWPARRGVRRALAAQAAPPRGVGQGDVGQPRGRRSRSGRHRFHVRRRHRSIRARRRARVRCADGRGAVAALALDQARRAGRADPRCGFRRCVHLGRGDGGAHAARDEPRHAGSSDRARAFAHDQCTRVVDLRRRLAPRSGRDDRVAVRDLECGGPVRRLHGARERAHPQAVRSDRHRDRARRAAATGLAGQRARGIRRRPRWCRGSAAISHRDRGHADARRPRARQPRDRRFDGARSAGVLHRADRVAHHHSQVTCVARPRA